MGPVQSAWTPWEAYDEGNPQACFRVHVCRRCVVAMRQLLGTTIFEARLTPDQQELVRGNTNVVLAEREMQRSAADSRARP